MQDSNKKISFGFNKLSKKINLFPAPQAPKEEKKLQLIQYLEDQSIKVIGDDANKTKEPLVIPMKHPNKKLHNLIDIVKNDFKGEDNVQEKPKEAIPETSSGEAEKSLSLDELATKELLNAANNTSVEEMSSKIIEVPAATEKPSFEGEEESTLDDYENIPISDFGMALLRGMGWKDGEGIGKNQVIAKTSQPIMRPKGMGLGADSFVKQKTEKPPVDREGKALTCRKGAYVKIIAGYHKGNYGQIIGFDDESGRFIIKTALNNINISLNEFLVALVTKEEYAKNSKVINNAKYEEYIKNEEKQESTKTVKVESTSDVDEKPNIKKEHESPRSEKHIKTELKEERQSKDFEKYDKIRRKNETRRETSNEKYKNDRRRSREREKYDDNRRHRVSRDSSDSENETYGKSKPRRGSKEQVRDSKYTPKENSDEYRDRSRKKHKKKNKRSSSEESSDDNYRRKSKKSSSRKYDSDNSDDYRKHKKDKSKERKHKSSSSKGSYRDRSVDDRGKRK